MTKITFSLERKPTIVKSVPSDDRVIPRETRKFIAQIEWLVKEGRFLEAADKANEHGLLLGYKAWDHVRGIQFHSKALAASKKAGNAFREIRAHLWLGFHYAENNQYEEAIAHYTGMLELVAKSNHYFDIAFAHCKIGQCCSDLGRSEDDISLLEKSVAHLKKALLLFRDHPAAEKSEFGVTDNRSELAFEARLFLGVSQVFMSEEEKGMHQIDAAFTLAERSGNLEHLKLVYAYRAIIAEHREDYKECLVNARKVLAICEKRGDEYFEKSRILADMGLYYQKLGRFQKALDAFERHKQLCEAFDTFEAIDAAQERIQEVYGLIEVESEVKRLDHEIAALEASHAEATAVCALRKERGVRYIRLGNHAEACNDLQFVHSAALAATGGSSKVGDYVALDLGKCLLKLGKSQEALNVLRPLARSEWLSPLDCERVSLLVAQALFAADADTDKVELMLCQILGKLQAIKNSSSSDSQDQEAAVEYQLEALNALCALYKKTKRLDKLKECRRDLVAIEDSRLSKETFTSQGSESDASSGQLENRGSSSDEENKLIKVPPREAPVTSNTSGAKFQTDTEQKEQRRSRNTKRQKLSISEAVTSEAYESGESDSDAQALPSKLSQLFAVSGRQSAPLTANSERRVPSSVEPPASPSDKTSTAFGSDCLESAYAKDTLSRGSTPEIKVTETSKVSQPWVSNPSFSLRAPFRVRVRFPLQGETPAETFIVPCVSSASHVWTVAKVMEEASNKFQSIHAVTPKIVKLTTESGDTLCPTDMVWDVVDDKSLLFAQLSH